ncbi:MAG: cob(I)yrinic acid a,c-diamide adenosyltransferase [Thermoplasmata archaeon]
MNQIVLGKIHVYTGDGKGKTTAAFGLAMRARGKGLRALVIQFLKGKGDFGEVVSARNIGIRVEQFGTGRLLSEGKISDEDRKEAEVALARAKKALSTGEADLVVLDEINVAVSLNLVDIDAVIEMMRSRPRNIELVLTGRNAHPELLAIADYVTEMSLVKHPFERGEKARPGIEF